MSAKHRSTPTLAALRIVVVGIATLSMPVLTGCTTVTPSVPSDTQSRVDSLEYDYAMNVETAPDDTRMGLEARLGGKVILFEPDLGFAIVGFDHQQASAQSAINKPNLERNKGVFLGGGQMAWMNGSVSAWAGGSVSAWAGGSVAV
ncbi:MAG: hypothetical protein HC933_13730, partial [Pleurocapsa sp. SU_196_0]|nr:hypothetical protein [Pleurocapsa sp. SU_196_0]